MSILYELSAILRMDASQYENALKKADGDTKSLSSRIGGALGTVGKIGAGAVAAASTAVATLTKMSLDSYANYEQLVGGVETLFGTGGMNLEEYAKSVGKSVDEARGEYNKLKKSETTVLKNSERAFKTAGMSANDYMETATSTAAALISSLGGDTEKAAQLTDQAIIDMSDNANKMGTSMESVQNAYNGFAKGNFQMLDNLKLGFGGTRDEMQRLLDKAGEISGYEYDISSYADIVSAIHVVQDEMGITGTTMREADATISGSFASMAAAWQNVMTSFGRGKEETAVAIQELVDAAGTYIGNIVPRIGTILENVGAAVVGIVPIITQELPGIVSDLLPGVLSAGIDMVAAIVSGLPSMVMSIIDAIATLAHSYDWLGLGLSIWDTVKSAFLDVWDWATGVFNTAVEAIKSIPWLEVGTTVWDWIKQAFDGIYDWAIETFENATTAIESIDWAGVGSWMWDAVKSAFAYIGSWFFTTFNEVPGKVKEVKWLELGKAIVNFVKTAIMGVAAMFKQFFQDAWDEVKEIDWADLGEKIWNWIIDKVKDFASWARAIFDFGVAQIKEIDWLQLGTDIWNWIIDKIKDFSGWAKSVFEFAVGQIKEIDWLQLGADIIGGIIDGLGDIAQTLGDFFESAWDAIQDIDWLGLGADIFDGIVDGLGDIVDWFAGLFDFTNIKIKWPHLTVTDWVDIPVVGRVPWGFQVDWYKKAMNQPYMFTQPTIFGAGEAGDEMMYGKANLMRDIKEAVSGLQKPSDNITINVYAQPGDDIDELARKVEQSLIRFEEQRKAAYA